MSRHNVLLECFNKLDKDKSGFIELQELRYFASRVTPTQNLEEANRLLGFLDANGDKRVSADEYTTTMSLLTTCMSDQDFDRSFSDALEAETSFAAGEMLVAGPDLTKYHHPVGSRDYLEEQVMPLLRLGMAELVKQVELDRLKLAAGFEWEGAQYLPHDWAPFSPLRWLADWLQQRIDAAKPLHWPPASPRELARPFAELGREEKIALAFEHLDRDSSGRLDLTEMLQLSGRLRRSEDVSSAMELLESMDMDRNGTADLEEFTELIMQLTTGVSDSEFDEGIRTMLSAGHLSYCTTREEKLAFLFSQLDLDHSGQINLEEMSDLARRLDPGANEEKIAATMEALGGTETVGQPEFVAAADIMFGRFTDNAALDAVIVRLLEARAAPAHDCAGEVVPESLANLARSMETHKRAPQVSGTDVMDKMYQQAPLLLIDVRSPEEQAVSWIPGALCVPCVADPAAPFGWSIPDSALPPIKTNIRQLTAQHGRAELFVVTYCNTGERGGAMALLLPGQLDGLPVHNLCGGVINYYNQGGNLSDPATGKAVQAVHPGGVTLQGYVTRPNKYKM